MASDVGTSCAGKVASDAGKASKEVVAGETVCFGLGEEEIKDVAPM